MKMRTTLIVLAVAIVGVYVAIGAGGCRLGTAAGFFDRTGGAQGISALFTGLTGILVAWYLYETHRLRLAAEREYSPFMLLTYEAGPDGTPANLFLRNLGRGPAVSVEVHGLYLHPTPEFHESFVRTQFPAVSSGAVLPIILPVPANYALLPTTFGGQQIRIIYADPAGRRWEQLMTADPELADVFRVDGLPKAIV